MPSAFKDMFYLDYQRTDKHLALVNDLSIYLLQNKLVGFSPETKTSFTATLMACTCHQCRFKVEFGIFFIFPMHVVPENYKCLRG